MKIIWLVPAFLVLFGSSLAQDGECNVISKTDLVDHTAPSFSRYAVSSPSKGLRPKLDYASNPIAKAYRSVLREDVSNGPNFAGHHRVTVWGCGSSCAMFAVTDLNSGKVITTDIVQSVSSVRLAADDFLPSAATEYWGFRFTKDSALLVVIGTLNEGESQQGAFYFTVKDDRLVLIHKTLVKKSCP